MSDAPLKATAQLSFSEALRALKHGDRVAASQTDIFAEDWEIVS